MAVPQKKFREVVFQILYSYELGGRGDERQFISLLDQFLVPRKTLYRAQEKASKIFSLIKEIDPVIAPCLILYDFDKISAIERNILRLAVYEMRLEKELSPKVALAEGVRLCRKFATPEGGAFINGVLNAIFQKESH